MSEKKSTKFQPVELQILVDEILDKKDILFGSFTSKVTKSLKLSTWDAITSKVNACNTGVPRSTNSVKKRWQDLSYLTKKKWNTIKKLRNQTGQNTPVPLLCPLEEKVLAIIGDIALCGINGGCDTLEPSTSDDVSQPPSVPEYVSQPPSVPEHVSQPPSVPEYVSQPPSVLEYVSQPLSIPDDLSHPTEESLSYEHEATETVSGDPVVKKKQSLPDTSRKRANCDNEKRYGAKRCKFQYDTNEDKIIQIEKEQLDAMKSMASSLKIIAKTLTDISKHVSSSMQGTVNPTIEVHEPSEMSFLQSLNETF